MTGPAGRPATGSFAMSPAPGGAVSGMTSEMALRFARQIALPEVGPDGQARICAARVLVTGGDLAAATAARYLEAGGVGAVIVREALPDDGAGWLEALGGVDLVVRSGFDDDAMLSAAARRGLPVVVARATRELVDLISFPRRPPAPTASLEVAPRAAEPPEGGAAAILAGTLAAAEALTVLARDDDADAPRAIRHLRLPLDGGAPHTEDIGAP
jgi:hypothetical protein